MIRVAPSSHANPRNRVALLVLACAVFTSMVVPAQAERVLPDIFVRPQKPQQQQQPTANRPMYGAIAGQQQRAVNPAYQAPYPAPYIPSYPNARPLFATEPSTAPIAPPSTIDPNAYAAPVPTAATPMPQQAQSPAPLQEATPVTPAPLADAPTPLPPPSTPLPMAQSASGTNNPAMNSPIAEQDFTPPPLSDSSLQNAVQNDAERAYYERRRKRVADTFERAYEGLVPLGPNEIRDVMGRYERTQRSAVPPSTGQPRGQVRIKTLSLEPGSDPPTVNVAAGYVSTIAIVDATGQPWPILDVGIGGNFEVSKTGGGQGSTHVVRLMPLTRFGFGNLSILLQDLPTPIIFKLASGGTTVDYRFDGRVPKLGPNAKLSLIERRNLQAGSALIMTFLDNAPPPDAKRVKISGADSRTIAWLLNDRMFVRTPLTMLSPSWDASVSSADGTTVYELKETPALLMSDNGNLIRARVAQREEE